jgi:hypothetical protein
MRDSTANQYGVSFDYNAASSSSSSMYTKTDREGYLNRRREIIKELQVAKAGCLLRTSTRPTLNLLPLVLLSAYVRGGDE